MLYKRTAFTLGFLAVFRKNKKTKVSRPIRPGTPNQNQNWGLGFWFFEKAKNQKNKSFRANQPGTQNQKPKPDDYLKAKHTVPKSNLLYKCFTSFLPKTWSSPRHNHHPPLPEKSLLPLPHGPQKQDFSDASSSFSSARHLLRLADLASSPWLSKRFQRLWHPVKTSNLQNKKGMCYWEASDVGIFRSLHSLLIHIKSFHVWEKTMGNSTSNSRGDSKHLWANWEISSYRGCQNHFFSWRQLGLDMAMNQKLKQYLCLLHLFYSHRNMGSLVVGGPTTQVELLTLLSRKVKDRQKAFLHFLPSFIALSHLKPTRKHQ